jgi:hypothetical protein
VQYDPILDCNLNGTLDYCDIHTGGSTDLNLNGIADDCEEDCNGNGAPDDYDIEQGASGDCNANEIPDECDTAGGASPDCNTNSVPDECETDCNGNGTPDDCDIAALTSPDCDLNGVPDECDMSAGASGCSFPFSLSENATGAADSRFTGPPDDTYYGLGGQIVTYEFDCGFVVDEPGPDFTVYEVDSGTAEFHLVDVLVSEDGAGFVSVKSSEAAAVNIPGDEQHGSNGYARSYDIAGSGTAVVRYVRLDGNGTGSAGSSAGFDLDAIGAVHRLGRDCDADGTLDLCQGLPDCDGNTLPDVCDIVPEGDCNANGLPDDCDIAGASTDCNHNLLPDECDIAVGTSEDCNLDGFPDECPHCPGTDVEVAFVMDQSDSMDDEGEALCRSISQIAEDLEADLSLTDVHTELLGIPYPGTGIYGCLTESVAGLYGTTVPGSPPPGNEILGDCPGGLQSPTEDWGRAVSVVSGFKPWAPDSVRLVVPLSDEGPWCGNPVSDPGVDRDSIVHAIWAAQTWGVAVSPVTCSGSPGSMVGMAQLIADSTGGQRFSSSQPAEDLAEGIKQVIYHACDAVQDCNHNDVPDECELDAGTLHDCDLNGVPDSCEEDCNGNGYLDSCDLSWGTSFDLNLNAVPDECEVIELRLDAAELSWTAVDGAVGYDLVRGNLVLLRSSGGDFSLATETCLVNDHPSLSTAHVGDPALAPGEGYWYLARAALGTMNLSYETFSASQVGWRDAEILASGVDCP